MRSLALVLFGALLIGGVVVAGDAPKVGQGEYDDGPETSLETFGNPGARGSRAPVPGDTPSLVSTKATGTYRVHGSQLFLADEEEGLPVTGSLVLQSSRSPISIYEPGEFGTSIMDLSMRAPGWRINGPVLSDAVEFQGRRYGSTHDAHLRIKPSPEGSRLEFAASLESKLLDLRSDVIRYRVTTLRGFSNVDVVDGGRLLPERITAKLWIQQIESTWRCSEQRGPCRPERQNTETSLGRLDLVAVLDDYELVEKEYIPGVHF